MSQTGTPPASHPTVAFFDASPADREYYPGAFGSGVTTTLFSESFSDDTAAQAAAATVLSIRTASAATATAMAKLPHLRHIACRTTGFDHVDLEYARAHGITVSTVPSYGENTVAEYAFLLLQAVARRLMVTAHATLFGPIDPDKLMGHDLAGKTLGVIGTGRIGRHAARIGVGYGMTVLGYDLYPNDAAAQEIGYRNVSLDQILSSSDYLTLHAPATPETHHLLDAKAFAKVKRGVIIVNTARGNLIDTPALIDALESGQVAAAGLDVLEGEDFLQLQSEMNLLDQKQLGERGRQVLGLDILSKMPHVLLTAHNAYNTAEALARIRTTSFENIQAHLAGKSANLVK
jgi:D-lactate dehydrogenase